LCEVPIDQVIVDCILEGTAMGNTITASWGEYLFAGLAVARGGQKPTIFHINREQIHEGNGFTFGEGFNLLPALTAE
jgi:hypothetical protein